MSPFQAREEERRDGGGRLGVRDGIIAVRQTVPPSLLPGSWTPVCGRACASAIVVTLRTESVAVAAGARRSQRVMLSCPGIQRHPSRKASVFSVDLYAGVAVLASPPQPRCCRRSCRRLDRMTRSDRRPTTRRYSPRTGDTLARDPRPPLEGQRWRWSQRERKTITSLAPLRE